MMPKTKNRKDIFMKKLFIVSLCLLLVGCAYSVAKESDGPYVNASATISKDINPNYAEINISVETKAKIADDAAKENAEISAEVVSKLKTLLDTRRGDSIETINYNLSPNYIYKDGKSILTGYSVSNTVKAKTRDIKSVSSLIDEAMKAGANNVSGLHFGFDEESLVCNELYTKATKNAYSQAQSVAKAIGAQVTGARNINTNCYIEGQHSPVRYYSKNAMADAAASSRAATPIEAKTLKVTATINGTFNIK